MGSIEMEKKYSLLKDVNFQVNVDENMKRGFSISFWVYISSFSASFPSAILNQVDSDKACNVPFLGLSVKKKLMLFPLCFLHQEAPSPGDPLSWIENRCASWKTEFPLKKWVHVGCEVSTDFVRLYINGVLVGEKPLSSTSEKGSHLNGPRIVSLSSTHEETKVNYEIQGHVYGAEVLSHASAVKEHYLKDPPLQLSIDESSALDINEDDGGVWSIVGGKASCRRNFSMDVILLNAVGQPVNKDLEVVASLLYADNETPVEKPNDAEAPLLTSYDGIEFASWDRPSKLINGRASFKLKISQLSSKCDNKLFSISFGIPGLAKYPFFKTLSHPIRCISRNRNPHAFPSMWKHQTSPMHLLNGSQSFGMDQESSDIPHNTVCEEKQSPSSKRVKLAQEKTHAAFRVGISPEQVNKNCNPPAWISNKDNSAYETSLRKIQEIHVEAEHCSSGSESNKATMSNFRSMSSCRNQVSESIVFKYCIEGPSERSLILREIAMLASEQELMDFAEQVSLYSGCFHHRHQIVMSKKLIEDGTKAWNSVSEKNERVLWENLAPEVEEQFKKISCCSTRYLSVEDLEVLRKIAGCQDLVTRENFERLWRWLYPVAFTLSQEWIKAIWDSVLPKWIEGLITKEEAEVSLQGNGRFQDPGTFVLRFPMSRSWPHPDAGNLVVTYVGCDYSIHHKLLLLDMIYSSGAKGTKVKPLKEMLLEEPELSRLGRIRRTL
ncbi:SH2 domain-containing protein [Heracleum sosnowskyi]|uniref:SH2 domain-containing protein n=1 Tax=Heracleum sosnowskyi TaxID=360622 RepID=A0AAD8H9S9_9APIA|nr:SH2 domain-containing protein [Heracleum sosnowskyi]